MSEFGKFERKLARILAKFPKVKLLAKKLYQRLVYFVHRKPYSVNAKYAVCTFGAPQAETFFGYYDKRPISPSGKRILWYEAPVSTANPPDVRHPMFVVIADEAGNEIARVETKTYNWQQGARAQWLTDDRFLFNDFDGSKQIYVSRVYSVDEGKVIRTYEYPVQDSFYEDYFLSLSYRRLMRLRPDYGYRNLTPFSDEQLADVDSDGIFMVDQATGKSRLIVPIARVMAIDSSTEFAGAVHKVNHIMISPDGERFIFIHRYFIGGQRFDRLMVADRSGLNVRVLAAYGMVSHCCWIDDGRVIAYLRGANGKDAYWVINVDTLEACKFGNGDLDRFGDGHPHTNGDWFVTDTYPDKSRMQKLILCNLRTGDIKELGEFFHGFQYEGESRCDLHPRLSHDGSKVFFDSVFSGRRRLCCLDLENLSAR